MVDNPEHPPDLPFAALMYYDLHSACVCSRRTGEQASFGGGGHAIVEFYTLFKLVELFPGHPSPHLGHVGLVYLMRRVGKDLGEVTIVGKNQQARCIDIQAAYWVKICLDSLDQFQNGVLRMGVAARAGVTCGLVQKYVYLSLAGGYRFSVDCDLIFCSVCLGAEFGNGLAI